MERRRYPTHHLRSCVPLLLTFAIGMLSLLLFRWSHTLAVAVFLIVWAGGILLIRRTDLGRCPSCDARLRREAGATDFECGRCGIAWETEIFTG